MPTSAVTGSTRSPAPRPGPERAEAVLAFWLGEVGPGRWYVEDPELDRDCAHRFGRDLEAARGGAFGAWRSSPRGTLGLLVLLDQLGRNVHRGTGQAFAGDARARAIAKAAIAAGQDLAVCEPERQFFYLPLMHSESVQDQARSVRLCLTRLPESGADNLGHAIRHRDVIQRFGRFPSRNAALGRPDREAERAWRAAGGYMG